MHAAWPEQCLLPDGQYIVVGDLQGGYGIMPYLEKRKDIKKIFLGDYLDSYIAQPGEQVRELMRVLNMVERGEAFAVWGNHEAQYFHERLRCSGYNAATAAMVMPMRREMEKKLRPFLYHEASRTLFSHAGVTKKLWTDYEMTFDNLVSMLHGWSLNIESPFFNIGRGRGGWGIGGPLWCDWHSEFEPVEGLSQVVGHTSSFNQKAWKDGERIGNLRAKNNSWNADCLGKGKTYDMLVFDTTEGFTGLQVNRRG